MKVVTFSIFKGGTAKTTLSVNTAAALAHRGKKVLVVDLDQQASATRYLDLDPDASPNLYEVFMGTQQVAESLGAGPFVANRHSLGWQTWELTEGCRPYASDPRQRFQAGAMRPRI